MNKFRNRGVTLIEIVISVAIFGILMVPIVSKMIQSMKLSSTAKQSQSRYELAENLMEDVKNSDAFTYDAIGTTMKCTDAYLNDIATSGSNIRVYKSPTGSVTSGGNSWDGFIVVGETEVGSKKEKYNYVIAVDNQEYALKEDSDSSYNNPNNMTLATIEDLDATKVAYINGTISNYDLVVSNAFMSKKLDILKVGDKARWEQYTKQQADIDAFSKDTIKRVIEVAVKNEQSGDDIKYTVTCTLKYEENSNMTLKDGKYKGHKMSEYLEPIEYVPYEATFTNELPNIYLMYNPCLYNGNYVTDDYILIDTSEYDETKKPTSGKQKGKTQKVNLFVVETAERQSIETSLSYMDAYFELLSEEQEKKNNGEPNTYDSLRTAYSFDSTTSALIDRIKEEKAKKTAGKANAYDALVEANKDTLGEALINTKSTRSRDTVNVNFLGRSKTGASNTDSFVTIYTNMYAGTADTDKSNRKNEVTADNLIGTHPIASMNNKCYKLEDTQLKSLSDSSTSASSLYNVKVYLSKKEIAGSGASWASLYKSLGLNPNGDESEVEFQPVLTGTKGGSLDVKKTE